ncbi:hypothetical protein [Flavobacterium sp. AED]|uniref:hypothetical protein n=1 Tax=Flavobacterium sp. AED TaxID=1423323 RepID=UPI00057D86BB|nr:hypothetical protein [Flavobacterium sp. AED]KIA82459.1 hypothetical protein OA85_16480 [Flavobacterium sp. AED]
MGKRNKIVILSFMLLSLFIENNHCVYSQKIDLEKDNVLEQQDSVFVINNSIVKLKTIKRCTLKSVNIDDNDFLNTNVQYLYIDSIDKKQLSKEKYYRNFLNNTHFLEFEESDFYKGNFQFLLKKRVIKNYGECYIGEFYFPHADNSAQRRAIVIINIKKKEISIWNFDDLIISKEGMKCVFNVRGEHSIYKVIYSLRCGLFLSI